MIASAKSERGINTTFRSKFHWSELSIIEFSRNGAMNIVSTVYHSNCAHCNTTKIPYAGWVTLKDYQQKQLFAIFFFKMNAALVFSCNNCLKDALMQI